MTDVMTKLKEIVERGYDNEDIQRGIVAAGKHQVDEAEVVVDEAVTEEEAVEEDAVEEVHEDVEEDTSLADMLKLAGRSGVMGLSQNNLIAESLELDEEEVDLDEEAVEETVEVPVQALEELMRLAGYEDYEAKIDEYENVPEEE